MTGCVRSLIGCLLSWCDPAALEGDSDRRAHFVMDKLWRPDQACRHHRGKSQKPPLLDEFEFELLDELLDEFEFELLDELLDEFELELLDELLDEFELELLDEFELELLDEFELELPA
jgi:hypothetical protein